MIMGLVGFIITSVDVTISGRNYPSLSARRGVINILVCATMFMNVPSVKGCLPRTHRTNSYPFNGLQNRLKGKCLGFNDLQT